MLISMKLKIKLWIFKIILYNINELWCSLFILFFVHLYNYLFENYFCSVPLKFHCAGKNPQCSKRHRPEPHSLRQLKSDQSLLLAMCSHFLQNKFLNFFVLDKIFNLNFINTKIFSCNNQRFNIGMDDSHIAVLQRVSVKKTLSNIRTSEVNVLDFLRSHILALTQFVNVLFSVDDFQSSVRQNDSDISAVVPAIFIDRLLGVLFIQVVTFEDWVSSGADLSSRRVVCWKVVHLRNVDKFELCYSIGTSYVTIFCITFISNKSSSCGLSLPIPLSYIALQSLFKKR